MFREIVRKVRLIAPTKGMIALIGIIYTIYFILNYLFCRLLPANEMTPGLTRYPPLGLDSSNFGRPILLICWSYAIFRAWRFNPLLNTQYRNWLAMTPWDRSKPSPLGPMMLSWEDIVFLSPFVLAGVWCFGWREIEWVIWPILIIYTSFTILSVFFSKNLGWLGVLLLISLPIYVPAFAYKYFGFMRFLLATHYIVAWISMREYVRTIPGLQSQWIADPQAALLKSARECVQWPLRSIAPDDRKSIDSPSTLAIVLLCAMGSWWFMIVLGCAELEPGTKEFSPSCYGLWLLGAAAIIIPLAVRLVEFRSPLNPLVRLFTLRVIVPRYDYVFVTPLIAGVILYSAPWLFNSTHGRYEAWGENVSLFIRLRLLFRYDVVVNGLILFVVSVLAFLGPPTFQQWRLLGLHRHAPWLTEAARERKPGRPSWDRDISFRLTR